MEQNETGTGARRYLKTREKPWAQKLAASIGRSGITPNMISIISVVFAIVGAICLMTASYASPWGATLLWLGAAACIQLRLLCNLLDGMVAIEGGKKSVVGGLYNEVPDRIADPLFLLAAGYSNEWVVKLCGIPLGWVAAVLSLMTAYIRVLGGTLGVPQSFMGPMAKQHRMFLLTLGCLGSIAELWIRSQAGMVASIKAFMVDRFRITSSSARWFSDMFTEGKPAETVMTAVLAIIVVGSVITCWRRLRLISAELHKKAASAS